MVNFIPASHGHSSLQHGSQNKRWTTPEDHKTEDCPKRSAFIDAILAKLRKPDNVIEFRKEAA